MSEIPSQRIGSKGRTLKPFLWGASVCKICGGECDKRSSTKRCRRCFLAAKRTGDTKFCSGCQTTLPIAAFYQRSNGGIVTRCKPCSARFERKRTKPLEHKEWRSQYRRREEVKAVRNHKISNRVKSDINFRLRQKLGLSIRGALANKRRSKAARATELLGCDIEQFKSHIEGQWRPGMSWSNWGKGFGHWQLDHIQPVSSFDLASLDTQKACFHFSNYQPLWFEENMEKAASLNWLPSQKIQSLEIERLAFIAARGVTRLPPAKARGL